MLAMSSRGPKVKGIQTALKNAGYDIDIDGKFETETDKIVRKFQGDYGLVVDGKVGIKTMEKLAQVVKARRNGAKAHVAKPVEPPSKSKVVIPIRELDELHPEDVKILFVHHSVTGPVDSKKLDEIARGKGHKCISYHKAALQNATMENGRPVNKMGAHAYALNHCSLGIVVVGDFTDKEPSDEQLSLVADQLAYWKTVYKKAIIAPHKAGPKYDKRATVTECPGDSFPWAKLIKMVSKRLGVK